jgi:hypothetical protein
MSSEQNTTNGVPQAETKTKAAGVPKPRIFTVNFNGKFVLTVPPGIAGTDKELVKTITEKLDLVLGDIVKPAVESVNDLYTVNGVSVLYTSNKKGERNTDLSNVGRNLSNYRTKGALMRASQKALLKQVNQMSNYRTKGLQGQNVQNQLQGSNLPQNLQNQMNRANRRGQKTLNRAPLARRYHRVENPNAVARTVTITVPVVQETNSTRKSLMNRSYRNFSKRPIVPRNITSVLPENADQTKEARQINPNAAGTGGKQTGLPVEVLKLRSRRQKAMGTLGRRQKKNTNWAANYRNKVD